MMEFSNRLGDASYKKGFFLFLAKKILQEEGKTGEFSLILVNEESIKELNRKYRARDEVTDVLSFCYQEGGKFVFPPKSLLKLGEIILCPPFIKKQAQKENLDFEEQLARVFVHGILHLLGYNHNTAKDLKKMEELQEKYLSQIYG